MKRIYNSDVRIDVSGMSLTDKFTLRFYTSEPKVAITKTQDDVDGNGYINLDWAMLQMLGSGTLSYTLTRRIEDASYSDGHYDSTVTRVTNYYIVSAVDPIEPEESGSTMTAIISLIEGFETDLRGKIAGEADDRQKADQALSDAITGIAGRLETLESFDATEYTYSKAEIDAKDAETLRQADILASNAQARSEQSIREATKDMATQDWVRNQNYLTQHQDLSNYLTVSDFEREKAHIAYKDWVQEWVNAQNFTTKKYVQDVLEGSEMIDLQGYYKSDETDALIAKASGETIDLINEQLRDYYTSGETIDLIGSQGYATTAVTDDLQEQIDGKQDTLVSGVSIKTINGESLLGEGDIEIKGGVSDEIVEYVQEEIESIKEDYITVERFESMEAATAEFLKDIYGKLDEAGGTDLSGYYTKEEVDQAVSKVSESVKEVSETVREALKEDYITAERFESMEEATAASITDLYEKVAGAGSGDSYTKEEIDNKIGNIESLLSNI